MFYGLNNGILCVFKDRRVFYAHQQCPDINLITLKLPENVIYACLLYITVQTPESTGQTHILLNVVQKLPNAFCSDDMLFNKD